MRKQISATIFLAAFCAACLAQPTTSAPSSAAPADSVAAERIFEMNDPNATPPAYPGGEARMLRFLAENIRYPAAARNNNIQGTAVITFIVEKNGSINDVTILKDPGGGCGAEAARVVSAMPDWNPGIVDNEPVRVRFTLPVRFKLEGRETKKEEKKKWWQRDALFGN